MIARSIVIVLLSMTIAPQAGAEKSTCIGFRVGPCIIGDPPPLQPEPECDGFCGKLSEQLERGCNASPSLEQRTGHPYADTIFLRRGLSDVPEKARRGLALAALAETLDGTAEHVKPLLEDPMPRVRFAAAVQLALTGARTGQISDPRVFSALKVLEETEGIDAPRSDLYFLRALAVEGEGDPVGAQRLARQAWTVEPRFFNALALDLRLQLGLRKHLRIAARATGDATQCMVEFEDLLDTLSKVADLHPCPSMAAHLELYLSRQLTVPREAPGFDAIMVYLAVLSKRSDAATAALDRFLSQNSPACAASVGMRLEGLISLLNERGNQ